MRSVRIRCFRRIVYLYGLEDNDGEVSGSEQSQTLYNRPAPHSALSKSDLLMGGLTRTTYPRPDGRHSGMWINALFVAPEFQGQGKPLKLVRAAEVETSAQGIPDLFVYMDVPHDYQNHSWFVPGEHGENLVLTPSPSPGSWPQTLKVLNRG